MDESWRMRMGMGMAASVNNPATLPGRKSVEDTSRRKNLFGNNNDNEINSSLNAEDFNDVFGGPPRSVLSRQFSSDGDLFTNATRHSNFFYQDIFQQHPKKLPEFRIPTGRRKDNEEEQQEEEFYGDIFGNLRGSSRSRSQSKSNSSTSVFSSSEEYLSPSFRPAVVEEDVDVSFIASKLRPINVSTKWNSSAKLHDVPQMPQVVPDFPFNRFHSYAEKHFSEHEQLENHRTSRSGSSRRVSSPETIGLEPNSHCTIKLSIEDLQLNSPSSVASFCHDHQKTDANIYKDQATQEQSMEQEEEEEDDDDEIMSSYVIEINLDNTERTGEALGIDEAIAWAKEKCQGRSSEKEWCMDKNEKLDPMDLQERPTVNHSSEGQIGGCASTRPQLYKKPEESAMKEDKEQLERDMELELLDEDVRLWSDGKADNIRLLLSTLHHILWPNSGWYSIPLSNLKDSAEVKKAYQKARLCLHPDKLQQRGATFPQKYIAEKAFPILQDAWAAFISQDAFLSRA